MRLRWKLVSVAIVSSFHQSYSPLLIPHTLPRNSHTGDCVCLCVFVCVCVCLYVEVEVEVSGAKVCVCVCVCVEVEVSGVKVRTGAK